MRRDKMGMKLLSIFPSTQTIPPTRLKNLKTMNLPDKLEKEILHTIELNRMLFEPWVQSAKGFQELKESLKKRGYKNMPISPSPLHEARPVSINTKPIPPKTKQIQTNKTMLRRGSRPA